MSFCVWNTYNFWETSFFFGFSFSNLDRDQQETSSHSTQLISHMNNNKSLFISIQHSLVRSNKAIKWETGFFLLNSRRSFSLTLWLLLYLHFLLNNVGSLSMKKKKAQKASRARERKNNKEKNIIWYNKLSSVLCWVSKLYWLCRISRDRSLMTDKMRARSETWKLNIIFILRPHQCALRCEKSQKRSL